jgi:hypothetical protein
MAPKAAVGERSRMFALPRRALLSLGAASLALCALPCLPFAASPIALPSDPANRRFTVLYKGGKIGTHTIVNTPTTGETHVRTQINLIVKAAFITMFSYSHRSEETWRDGRLAALASVTEEGGDKFQVEGSAVPQGFRIVGKDGPFIAPAGALTSNSLWSPAVLDQQTVIDAQHGGMTGVSATKLGDEQIAIGGRQIRAARYKFITPYLAGFIWYDDASQWVHGQFERDGARIEYQLDA